MNAFAIRSLLLLLLASGVQLAWAQARDIRFELGFAGQVVADRWNPLRVSLRDQPAARLVLEIDRGNLREGEQIVRYEAALAAGSGLYVFEDDVFVPTWRQLTWSVRTPEAVLASGSLDRRQVDPRPLHLVVARDVGSQRQQLGDEARVVDVLPNDLPTRGAAYAGVDSLVLEGTTAAPSARAVAAAAAAGVRVVVLEPLPERFDPLAGLVPAEQQRLGSGWLIRAPPGDLAASLTATARLDTTTLLAALSVPPLDEPPQGRAQVVVLAAAAAYALVVVLLVRLGRLPGLLSAVMLAALVTVGSWQALRPSEATTLRSRSLSIGGGTLAHRLELRSVFSRSQQEVRLPVSARLLDTPQWQTGRDETVLDLPRWSAATLALKPRLEPATLRWDGETLYNDGELSLGEIFVLGYGVQTQRSGVLGPGERLGVTISQDSLIPDSYSALVAHLPMGSALARSGGQIFVALSDREPWAEPRSEVR
ncbi:MAG: hypothetical protein U5L04_00320 [Trueperaceae bacterium]|nr:hypothetical protein [Trueperaceae bacterium]